MTPSYWTFTARVKSGPSSRNLLLRFANALNLNLISRERTSAGRYNGRSFILASLRMSRIRVQSERGNVCISNSRLFFESASSVKYFCRTRVIHPGEGGVPESVHQRAGGSLETALKTNGRHTQWREKRVGRERESRRRRCSW